ncbi:unnamed protein product [Adineta steineri]|uniref:Uncharacterized protein n=1 Tax=Adineta steineri TaxID=433720 RepID=A0A815ELV2_9BILA|nr:unnamed protein product [Adineta steineri]
MQFLTDFAKTGKPTPQNGAEWPVHQQSSSFEDNEQFDEVKRDALDSGEEQYFKWASLNRRPMESLVGRKRFAELIVLEPKPSRIVAGIWRSGLVG